MIKTKETSSVILLILVLCLKLVLVLPVLVLVQKIQFPRNLTRHKVNNALTRL